MKPKSLSAVNHVRGVIFFIFTTCAIAANGDEVAAYPSNALIKNLNCSVRQPKENNVLYKGMVGPNSASGGNGAMLYPAPDAVSFFVAVIAHGLLVESSKKSAEDELQVEADKVLLAYQDIMRGYTHKELMQQGLDKMVAEGRKELLEFNEKPRSDLLIESTPTFYFTQDQSTFVLDNAIVVYKLDTPELAIYQNTIRVVSDAKVGIETPNYWISNQGEQLKETNSRLFAESLDIALNAVGNVFGENGNTYKTIHYFEGGSEKMERGQILSEHCNRVIFKTLRGWLMSVPARTDATSPPTEKLCA